MLHTLPHPVAQVALAAGSSTPWWAWVVAALVVSTLCSVLVGRQLHRASAAYPLAGPAPQLGDRRRLDQDLPAALGRDGSVGLLVAHLDQFAEYQVDHGDDAGEVALQRVAQVLAAHVRPTDVVYRYDDARFGVLLADATAGEAAGVAERIRSDVEAVALPDSSAIAGGRLTVSVGVALAEAAEPSAVTATAESALDAARDAGGNRIAVAPVGV
jgi:diguanylate cyclase (GGDEF)-like protein